MVLELTAKMKTLYSACLTFVLPQVLWCSRNVAKMGR